jgi:GntR family transcriptional regulator, transcriptional repressor for pyruvate dehydrogenase complex
VVYQTVPVDTLQPIRRTRLYEEVADRLRELIEAQGLNPGDRLLSERALASQLGVSRTVVRQALTALRTIGLVEMRHGDGVYLRRSPDEIIPQLAHEILSSYAQLPAIMEVREALETQTARLAARRRSADDLAQMRSALDDMAKAIEREDDPEPADQRFHAAITAASKNPLLQRLMDQLAEPISQTRRASLARPGRPPKSLEGHRRIVGAIAAKDEDAAAERMREHLTVVADVAFVIHDSNDWQQARPVSS